MLEKRRNFVLGKRRSFILEIGAVLKLFQACNNGPYGRPTTENGATHLGLPSECANGPSNLGPRTLSRRHSLGLSGEWTHGPNKIRPERRLLEAPMDRMRSYP